MQRFAAPLLWLSAVALATCASSCQSTTADFADPPGAGDRWTLGELVYEILHANLERADQCSPEMVRELEGNRDRFVETFDYTISKDIVNGLPELLGGTILPLVDSGDIPALTEATAEALALLIDDEFDRDRKTLGAIVSIGKARTVLEESQAIDLVSRVLADPALEEKIHALAALALEHDGADLAVSSALDLARRWLTPPDEPSACGAVGVDDLRSRLLRTDGFVADPRMGEPAWSARVDANGNPLVRTDPVTGTLYEPFVDADGDGAADVDAEGRPVDASGAPVHIPVVGTEGARDSQGRALAADGEPLYAYYDAKQTFVAHALRLLREAAEADVHGHVSAIAHAALGEQLPCSDGTGTCYRYASTDHPIADLLWMLLEATRYERASVLLQSVAGLVRDNPRTAERLLVAAGDLLVAFEESGLDIADPELVDVAMELAPLHADVFAADNTTGESTARLLLYVVHQLGDVARDFPDQLAMVVDYVRLHKDEACSAEEPDLSRSVPVDYDRPRYYTAGGTTIDNRASVEQSIELLDNANCGEVPFSGGKTVAYVLLDIMANRDPSTVCNMIDTFLGASSIAPGASRWTTVAALDAMGCDGDAVYDDLQALDDLAKSGALDFLIPVLRVFDERDQLDTVLEIIGYLADDLRKDEDGDPATRSALRRFLPVLSRLLDTNAPDVVFDVVDLLVAVPASDGDGTLDLLVIDALDNLLRDDQPVSTRQGTRVGTSLAVETLRPLRDVVVRLDGADGGPHLDALVDFLRGHVARTRVVGGERRLEDPNLVPLIGEILAAAARTIDGPREDYVCWLGEVQEGSETLLTGREFATAVRLLRLVSLSRHGATVEEWLTGLLRPRPDAPEGETLGPILQITAALVQSDVATADLREVLRWLGAVAAQRGADGPELVRIVDGMLTSDENDVLLTIARTLFAPGPLETREAPMSTFDDVFDDVAAIRPDNMCVAEGPSDYDVADAEEVVGSVVEFMHDDETGLGAIYELVGQRSTNVDRDRSE